MWSQFAYSKPSGLILNLGFIKIIFEIILTYIIIKNNINSLQSDKPCLRLPASPALLCPPFI